MLRAFRSEHKLALVGDVLTPLRVVFSCLTGVRPPSASLFPAGRDAVRTTGPEPSQVLHVSHRLETGLIPLRRAGDRTMLVIADTHWTQMAKPCRAIAAAGPMA